MSGLQRASEQQRSEQLSFLFILVGALLTDFHSSRQVTPGSEIRLLSHLFLVCLSYEGYVALDYQTLSNDMVYNNRKTIELLKMLGCRVVQPRGKDLERIYASWRTDGRTIPSLEGGKLKVASLIIPLEFPKEKSGKAKGRK